jgi:MFS superfamily sulfate permease-like transporter
MGIAYFVIGRLNLVSVVQYIPYPVMAGFLVGVGVYLVEAA